MTSATRLEGLPDVPTVAESGVAGFDVTSWYGIWAPKGTPPEIVAKVNAAMRQASRMRSLQQQRLQANAAIADDLEGEAVVRFITAESEKWLGVMRRAGVQPR